MPITVKRYVLRYAHNFGADGFKPVENDGRVDYLYKSVTHSKRTLGLGWKITDRIEDARTWATREGVEGYLAKHLTTSLTYDNGITSHFVVEEVTA